MISSTSRYSQSPTAVVTVNGKARQIIEPGPQSDFQITYTSYQVTGADRVDLIAQSFYGDPSKWYAFADANPEIMDWSDLPVGYILRIPQL